MLDTAKQDYTVELREGCKTQLTVYGPRRVRFHWLTGDMDFLAYGGKWISNRQSNGEFDYYFVIEILNWKDRVPEDEAPLETYNVSLSVVSPQEAGKDNARRAMDCCGIEEEMLERAIDHGPCEEILVEALHGYGLSVPVWSGDGNNHKALMREARDADSGKPVRFRHGSAGKPDRYHRMGTIAGRYAKPLTD